MKIRRDSLGPKTPLLRSTVSGLSLPSPSSTASARLLVEQLRPQRAPSGIPEDEDGVIGSAERATLEEEHSIKREPVGKEFVFLAFRVFVLGLGTLLPWNMFLNAYPYFFARFQNSSFRHGFENFFIVSFQFFNLTCLLSLLRFQNRLSYGFKVELPFWVQLAVFCIFVAFIFIPSSAVTFFVIHVLLCGVAGLTTGLVQGGVFALVGLMPAHYILWACIGQGFGAILMAVSNIATLYAGETVEESAFFYFSSAVLIGGVCIWAYKSLIATKFLQSCLRDKMLLGKVKEVSLDTVTEACPLIGGPSSDNVSVCSGESLANTTPQIQSKFAYESDLEPYSLPPTSMPFLKIFKKVWHLAVGLCSTFSATFALYPGVQSLIKPVCEEPTSSRYYLDFWVSFYVFLYFSIGDFVGRTLSLFVHFPKSSKVLSVLLVLRWVFIPLFLMCNFKASCHQSDPDTQAFSLFSVQMLSSNNVAPILLMFLFAISNGYLCSLALMYAPHCCIDASEGRDLMRIEKETVGFITIASIVLGITFGTLSSFYVKTLIS
eukprot:Nk52_evm84s207 gene=Nk52_evmTU84s207